METEEITEVVQKQFTTDSLILVFYVNVSTLNESDIEDYINKVANRFKREGVHTFFIPTVTGKDEIRCINPTTLSEHSYKYVSEFLNHTQDRIEEFFAEVRK